MIPWIPALPAHTGSKPWKYKTSDGVIRERGDAADVKADRGAAVEAEAQRQSKGAEAAATDSLDDELAPKQRKSFKKDSGKGSKRSAGKGSEVESEPPKVEPATPKSSSRLSQRGRGDAHTTPAQDDSKPVSSKSLATPKKEVAERQAEAGADAEEGDDFDFDSALERKKSAYASKTNKATDKPTARTKTKPTPTIEPEEVDDAGAPEPEPTVAAATPTTPVDTPTGNESSVVTAESTKPASEGEEELSVAGVLPTKSPESRRTKKNPVSTKDKLPAEESETDESLAAAAPTTMQGESEPLSELAGPSAVETVQSPANAEEAAVVESGVSDAPAGEASNAQDSELDGETQKQQQAADADGAAGKEDIPSPASTEATDSLAAGVTDNAAAENSVETQARTAIEPEGAATNTDVQTVNVDPQPSTPLEDKPPAAAATDDLSVASLSESPTTADASPLASLNSSAPTSPNELDLARADTPQIVEAGGAVQEVPPVETPTPRRIDHASNDERDNALQAQDAAQPTQPATDPLSIDATTPSEPATISTPISSMIPPLGDIPTDSPLTPSTPVTDVVNRPPGDNPPNDMPNTPASVPSPPTDIEPAIPATPAAADSGQLTDSNNAELPVDTMTDSTAPDASSDVVTDPETDAAADGDVDSGGWKRSTSSSSASFLRRSFTAGFVLCVVIGCVVLIGKKVKETLDSHEDEGSEGLLSKMEAGAGRQWRC